MKGEVESRTLHLALIRMNTLQGYILSKILWCGGYQHFTGIYIMQNTIVVGCGGYLGGMDDSRLGGKMNVQEKSEK